MGYRKREKEEERRAEGVSLPAITVNDLENRID